jgi:hypothetical protein
MDVVDVNILVLGPPPRTDCLRRKVAALIHRMLTESNPRPRYLVGRDAHVAAVVARLPERLRARLVAGHAAGGAAHG